MRVAEILQMARESGVHIGIEGADLILDAEREPTSRVLEAIRRHKAGIVDLLTAEDGNRTAEGWRVFYDERANILQHDHGLSRQAAEHRAFDFTVIRWLNRHPEQSDPGHCAWCRATETSGARIVPYGANQSGHVWLHPACWQPWHDERRQSAISALAAFNIDEPGKEKS
jgi:hypothetical protein